MIIEDYTINKKFSELKEGVCFVLHSDYYMKLFIRYYNEYTCKTEASYKNYAVNLKTGVAEVVKEDEKVRVVDAKMIIG